MHTLTDLERQWQDAAIESFLKMVKAFDGDFDAIAQLSIAFNKPI